MSLNRVEQFLFDYLQSHPEEGQHWRQKVQALSRSVTDPLDATRFLEADLWAYYSERAANSRDFRGHPAPDLRRTSMKNLSDYLFRLWVAPSRKAPKVS